MISIYVYISHVTFASISNGIRESIIMSFHVYVHQMEGFRSSIQCPFFLPTIQYTDSSISRVLWDIFCTQNPETNKEWIFSLLMFMGLDVRKIVHLAGK